MEEGFSEDVAQALRDMGHDVTLVTGHDRAVFGRGQIIWRNPKTGVMWGGSDPRADGQAVGW